MNIDTKTLVSITDANHNFSRVTKIVEEHGSALILKNNAPKYLMLDLTTVDEKSVESIMKKTSAGKKSSK
ncbi:type II toxin-antitoxin system Phd/YefM family antitoxin [Butyrivibrio sp.]|uniref:type II toxin-antitoxin system Phd/YefM family antitoxin n=1 Tax=Butyrivibrio sp. TaxID=28121 RepID=UPI0025C28243|nr:type II toxin-antitoxin system Phd/YefM family antitoxin [Butyrivibrio sp.]MBE5838060.1 type II toxin-antitoxin system Phd/YefM family antitoxin [Butyrivibrio sp.]